MALHYQLTFALLMTEISYVIFLLTPIRKVRQLLVWFGKSKIFNQILYLNKIVMSFVFILFVDAGYRMLKVHREDQKSDRVDMDALLHSKLFYAQRNFYLTGFTLLLDMIIVRMQHMISSLEGNDDKVRILKKQGLNTNDQYMKLQDEVDALKSKIKEMEDTVKEADRKIKDADGLKKQVDGVQREYDRLMDEYNKLEKKYNTANGTAISDSKKDQ
eukprot:NODE_992_length_2484_cov_0.379455.p1 type:complete len:216 gc:universal NODE_992_length_2484_cov_0.379455:1809-1162(-)